MKKVPRPIAGLVGWWWGGLLLGFAQHACGPVRRLRSTLVFVTYVILTSFLISYFLLLLLSLNLLLFLFQAAKNLPPSSYLIIGGILHRTLFTDDSVKRNKEGAAGFTIALSSGEILFSSATVGFLSSFTVEFLVIFKALQICDREN